MPELTCLLDPCVLPGARLIEIAELGQWLRQMDERRNELIDAASGVAAECGIGQREQFLLQLSACESELTEKDVIVSKEVAALIDQ
jgi:hypothetical protein